jgi:hypothetical protein
MGMRTKHFCLEFFDNFKYFKIEFRKKGANDPGSQNALFLIDLHMNVLFTKKA